MWASEWQGWDDWLGTMLPLAEAQAALRGRGLRSEEAYRDFYASNEAEITARLPSRPSVVSPYSPGGPRWLAPRGEGQRPLYVTVRLGAGSPRSTQVLLLTGEHTHM